MCHLLKDSSPNVQKMAYRILQESARKWTEHLVIEAGVDVEDTVKTELPSALLDILQRSTQYEDEMEYDEQVRSARLYQVAVLTHTLGPVRVSFGVDDSI
jgi:hypothetical protein